MQRRTWIGTALVAATVCAASGAAAQERVEVYENTARVLDQGRLRLGLFAFDYGLIDGVSIGIDVPAWLSRAYSDLLLPNVHVKFRLFDAGPVQFSGRAAVYYGTLNTSSTNGQLAVFPLSLFGSVQILPRVWLHADGSYTYGRAFGSTDIGKAKLGDAELGTRTAQAGLMLEWRLTRLLALLARGRYQFYERPIVVRGSGNYDAYTRIDLAAEAQPRTSHPWLVVGGAALTWTHVGFIVGAGYGEYVVPGSNLVLPYKGVIPEIELTVQF